MQTIGLVETSSVEMESYFQQRTKYTKQWLTNWERRTDWMKYRLLHKNTRALWMLAREIHKIATNLPNVYLKKKFSFDRKLSAIALLLKFNVFPVDTGERIHKCLADVFLQKLQNLYRCSYYKNLTIFTFSQRFRGIEFVFGNLAPVAEICIFFEVLSMDSFLRHLGRLVYFSILCQVLIPPD